MSVLTVWCYCFSFHFMKEYSEDLLNIHIFGKISSGSVWHFVFVFFIILFYKAVVDQLLLNLCIIALFIRDFPPILQAVLTNSDRKIISFVQEMIPLYLPTFT